MFQYTASMTGMVHLIKTDEPARGYALCGRRAVTNTNAGQGGGVAWPRWSASDRGIDPIQRRNCPICAQRARRTIP